MNIEIEYQLQSIFWYPTKKAEAPIQPLFIWDLKKIIEQSKKL